jgi:hypothetical protein
MKKTPLRLQPRRKFLALTGVERLKGVPRDIRLGLPDCFAIVNRQAQVGAQSDGEQHYHRGEGR